MYQRLDGLSTSTIPSRATKKTFSYFASPSVHDFITAEVVTSVQTTLSTSNKNTSTITKNTSITLNELAGLPLIRFVGSDFSIQNYLPNSNLTFCIDVDNATHISKILNQRPELYTLGTNLFLNQESMKCIAIPVKDAPRINLTLVYKNNEHNTEIYSRISTILRSLYAI